MMQLGFIGAGRMAAPMIRNLLADGHAVTVWNRTTDKACALLEAGADVVTAASDCATRGGVVLSCLADDNAMDAVLADGQLVAALGEGGIHVVLGTISAGCAERHAAQHEAGGVHYLAAPVLGRPEAVAARMPSFLLAGHTTARSSVKPLLESLGQRVFEFGEQASAANIAKINFNFLIAAAVNGMAEALAVVEKSGVDPKQFYDMLAASAFGCPIYQTYGKILVEHAWDEVGFALNLGLKDVMLANQTAAACDSEMQLGTLMQHNFEQAIAAGLGDLDWTAVSVPVRERMGLK